MSLVIAAVGYQIKGLKIFCKNKILNNQTPKCYSIDKKFLNSRRNACNQIMWIRKGKAYFHIPSDQKAQSR